MSLIVQKYAVKLPNSFFKYLVSTLLVLVLYFFSINGLVDSKDPIDSLIVHCAIGLVCAVVYSQVLLNDHKVTVIVFFSFIFYALFGYFHYTTFVDPNYFAHPTTVIYSTMDYPATMLQIETYIDTFDYTFKSIWDNAIMPHPELYAILSIIFKTAGNFILTFIPINCLFRFMSAISIAYLVKSRGNNYKIAIFLGLIFVLLSLSSQMGRYSIGLFMMTSIMVLFQLSNKWSLFWIIITSYIFYLMRSPYVLVPFLAYVLYLFFDEKNVKRSNKRLWIMVIAIFIIMATASYFNELLFERNDNERYMKSINNIFTYILFPVKYFIAIVGPFPWTYNHFFRGLPEFTHYITSPFNSCMAFYVTLIIFPYIYHKMKNKKTIDYLAFVALLIMALAVMSSAVNLGYTIFGFLFFIPTVVEQFNKNKLISFVFKYFSFMIMFNLFYVALGISGIKSIFGS